MSKQIKQPKPRITSWIRTNFGEEILAEIVSGKRKISLNGNKLDAKADNFRDKRVTATSQIEITPEPKVLAMDTDSKYIETLKPVRISAKDVKKAEKELDRKGIRLKDIPPSKEMIDLHKKYSGKAKVPEPEHKVYVKDFLTEDQIKSLTDGRANLFVDGLSKSMHDEIQVDNDTNPMINGKVVTIKVMPAFRGG